MPKAFLVSIVEDDTFFRDSMRRLMKSLGHSAEAFSSATAFLASPRLVETACLIADVNMPAMTGIELYRHLIEIGHAIPTIPVTAYPDDDACSRALKGGVICYLRKPVEEQLKRCLRTASRRTSCGLTMREASSSGPLVARSSNSTICTERKYLLMIGWTLVFMYVRTFLTMAFSSALKTSTN
jgi:FixJ family two-component response regulator